MKSGPPQESTIPPHYSYFHEDSHEEDKRDTKINRDDSEADLMEEIRQLTAELESLTNDDGEEGDSLEIRGQSKIKLRNEKEISDSTSADVTVNSSSKKHSKKK